MHKSNFVIGRVELLSHKEFQLTAGSYGWLSTSSYKRSYKLMSTDLYQNLTITLVGKEHFLTGLVKTLPKIRLFALFKEIFFFILLKIEYFIQSSKTRTKTCFKYPYILVLANPIRQLYSLFQASISQYCRRINIFFLGAVSSMPVLSRNHRKG